MGSEREHRNMIRKLKDKFAERYLDDFIEYKYWESQDHINANGDLDYAGVYETSNGYGLDIYEVKSGKGRKKAREQLERAKQYFSEFFDEINCFRWIKGDGVEKIET